MDNQFIITDILDHLTDSSRNIISDDFEKSLAFLRKYIDVKIHRYKTGSECWTWNIPQKWRVRNAHIKHKSQKILSFEDHPLHVMSYSTPVNRSMRGDELKKHIYTHKESPEAIPYEFSFYIPKWGFCLTHQQAEKIDDSEEYEVVIDSEFTDDYLTLGEYTIKGTSDEHVFFLSHLDHPFQANDGLVGVAVNVALAKLLEQQKDCYYNYTFLFVPETIGSIAYLSRNEQLIPRIRYSVFVEMVGLDNPMIIQKSFNGESLIDQYAASVLRERQEEAKSYPFLTVACNDEKIFDSPGVNIPSISITRVNQEAKLKKMGNDAEKLVYPYPQYHSHLDDGTLINTEVVCDTVSALHRLVQVIENDFIPKRTFKGPVFLSKYGIWPDWRTDLKMSQNMISLMYALEGDQTVFEIAQQLNLEFDRLVELLNKFHENKLITKERIPIGFDRAS